MHYGSVFQKLHEETGISKAEIAHRADMDCSNYGKLLKRSNMECATFEDLCAAFGLKVSSVCRKLEQLETSKS